MRRYQRTSRAGFWLQRNHYNDTPRRCQQFLYDVPIRDPGWQQFTPTGYRCNYVPPSGGKDAGARELSAWMRALAKGA